MKRIIEFLRNILKGEDLMDSELYFQVMGNRVAETGIPKAKAKITIVKDEDGNETIVNVTEIGRLDCGHWNVDIGAQCCVCGETYCKYCVSERVGFICSGCGKYVCPSCSRHSVIDPDIVLCGRCGSFGGVPSIIRRFICDS